MIEQVKSVVKTLVDIRNDTVDNFNELRMKMVKRFTKNVIKVNKEVKIDAELVDRISAYDEGSIQHIVKRIDEIK